MHIYTFLAGTIAELGGWRNCPPVFPMLETAGDSSVGLGWGDAVPSTWHKTSSCSRFNEGDNWKCTLWLWSLLIIPIYPSGSENRSMCYCVKAPWMRVIGLPSIPPRYALTRWDRIPYCEILIKYPSRPPRYSITRLEKLYQTFHHNESENVKDGF